MNSLMPVYDLTDSLSLCRDLSARLVASPPRHISSTMHIIISNSQSKLDIFLQEKVFQGKLTGDFGCGVVVAGVNSVMVPQNLQKGY